MSFRRISPIFLCAALLFAMIAICTPTWSYAKTATTTTLQVTPTCLAQGCLTTLNAATIATSTPVHAGLVFFCDGTIADCENGVVVGRAQLTAAGTATIKALFAPGIHHLHAYFHGTAGLSSSQSSTQDLTIAPAQNEPTTAFLSATGTGAMATYNLQGGVSTTGPLLPTGTLSFIDQTNGNSVLGTAELKPVEGTYFSYMPGGLDISQIPASVISNAFASASGDFNNDGFQDIATVTAGGVNVLLGSGTGKFTLAPSAAVTTGQLHNRLVVGDFNSDGKLDIAIPDAINKKIYVSLGNGDGTFTSLPPITVSNNPEALSVADINNDGVPDLLATVATPPVDSGTPPNAIQPLLGRGDGTFTDTKDIYAKGYSLGFYATQFAIADFDRDGTLDIVTTVPDVSAPSGMLGVVLHGNGDGSFTQLTKTFAATAGDFSSGDFNGDGIADLVGADGPTLTYYAGIGDGTFTETKLNIYNGDFIESLHTGDFDGDGVLDVATFFDGDFEIFRGTKDPINGFSFQFGAIETFPKSTPDLAIGDFNNDGLLDLVGLNPSTIYVSTNQIGTFANAKNLVVTTGAGNHSVVASYAGDAAHASSVSAPVIVIGVDAVNDSNGFTDATGLSLNGGSTVQDGVLQLTDGKQFEARSAFTSKRLPTYQFVTNFDFQIPSNNADGFAFVLQSNGPNAIGSGGGGLGYGQVPGAAGGASITNSVAVVFDLHSNQNEGNNSVRIENGGVTSPAGALDLGFARLDLHSGHRFNALITNSYSGQGVVYVVITDLDTQLVVSLRFNVDVFHSLGDSVGYVGFTSGTGATSSTINILNWKYEGSLCCNLTPPTPQTPSFAAGFTSAGSQLQLNGGAVSGSALQLTNGSPFEATSAYYIPKVQNTNWTSDFDFQMAGPGGDGFTFILQGRSLNALGFSGGELGYGGITDSVAVKFDIHNNAGEGVSSTGLYLDGAAPTVPAINLNLNRISLYLPHMFHARLYENTHGVLTLSITDLTTYAVSTTILGTVSKSGLFNVGFTAGTGATANTIKIFNWTWYYSDVE